MYRCEWTVVGFTSVLDGSGSDSSLSLSLTRKVQAEVKHQFSIDELKHREHLIQAQQAEEQARQAELEEHQAAFVELLNGSFLFDSMYAEDVEGSKLAALHGVGELLEAYPFTFTLPLRQSSAPGPQPACARPSHAGPQFPHLSLRPCTQGDVPSSRQSRSQLRGGCVGSGH
ncbi:hypothetical protein QTO34_009723 [Cnephaeus nilssonii]|uniref:Uncharacterized protein n=1 Tax=Cnephaeus nilssonii TaxID=3371016 RepID=A0AA40HIG1_CNENI|nr:hypothetical protein QTO34_009723 [Eptesicus nilssonii]